MGNSPNPKPTLRRPGDPSRPMGQIAVRDHTQDFHDMADRMANAWIAGEDPEDPKYLHHMQTIRTQAELGKLQHERENPSLPAQTELNKLQWERENPRGSPENHPGKLGKLGHVMGTIGQAAGMAFAPGVMDAIPGTYLNRMSEEGRAERLLRTESQADTQQAEAERQRAMAQQTTEMIPGQMAEATAKTNLTQNEADLRKTQNEAAQYQLELEKQFAGTGFVLPQMPPESANGVYTQADLDKAEQATQQMERLAGMPGVGKMFAPLANSFRQLTNQRMTLAREQNPNKVGSESYLMHLTNDTSMTPEQKLAAYQKYLADTAGKTATARNLAAVVPVINPKTNTPAAFIPKGSLAGLTNTTPSDIKADLQGGLTPPPPTKTVGAGYSAKATQEMITNNILPKVYDAEKKGLLGPGMGTVQQWLAKHIGNPTPEDAEVLGLLKAIPPMLAGMYTLRSAKYIQAEQDFLNLSMDGPAIIAYLRGVYKHAGTLRRTGGVPKTPTARTGASATGQPATGQPKGRAVRHNGKIVGYSEDGGNTYVPVK